MFGRSLEKFLADNNADTTWVYQGVRKLAAWRNGRLIVWTA